MFKTIIDKNSPLKKERSCLLPGLVQTSGQWDDAGRQDHPADTPDGTKSRAEDSGRVWSSDQCRWNEVRRGTAGSLVFRPKNEVRRGTEGRLVFRQKMEWSHAGWEQQQGSSSGVQDSRGDRLHGGEWWVEEGRETRRTLDRDGWTLAPRDTKTPWTLWHQAGRARAGPSDTQWILRSPLDPWRVGRPLETEQIP